MKMLQSKEKRKKLPNIFPTFFTCAHIYIYHLVMFPTAIFITTAYPICGVTVSRYNLKVEKKYLKLSKINLQLSNYFFKVSNYIRCG